MAIGVRCFTNGIVVNVLVHMNHAHVFHSNVFSKICGHHCRSLYLNVLLGDYKILCTQLSGGLHINKRIRLTRTRRITH